MFTVLGQHDMVTGLAEDPRDDHANAHFVVRKEELHAHRSPRAAVWYVRGRVISPPQKRVGADFMTRELRLAVAGHVEWVTFMPVDDVPRSGDILHATDAWEEPAGGGGVAVIELARLAGSSTLVTALGDDPAGQRLPEVMDALGVRLLGVTEPGAHRRCITLLDPTGERTIVVIGPSQHGRGDDHDGVFSAIDAVYFCKGDAQLLREARQARVLVATARVLPVIRDAGVQLDALVLSGRDPSERYAAGDLPVSPQLVAITDGENGGSYTTNDGRAGRWKAVPVPGSVVDSYGAGDCFAAGLTWALGRGLEVDEALAAAAKRGALALTRAGAGWRDETT